MPSAAKTPNAIRPNRRCLSLGNMPRCQRRGKLTFYSHCLNPGDWPCVIQVHLSGTENDFRNYNLTSPESVSLADAENANENNLLLHSRKFSSAKNFRQKRPSGSSSLIYFRQTLVVACLLFDLSVVALLLIVYLRIHEYFWSPCGLWKNLVTGV